MREIEIRDGNGWRDARPNDRLPVEQGGRVIGTLPAEFDPMAIKSRSFLYTPRGGDFIRHRDKWEANRMLGPGDLQAVPGFVPNN